MASISAIVLCIGITLICIVVIVASYVGTKKVAVLNMYSENAMIIVEPRMHEHLSRVLLNFDSAVDTTWDLYIFHGSGKKHGDHAKAAVAGIEGHRNVFFCDLGTKNLNANQYNRLFKQASFWNRVHAENILVFQTDAAVCKNTKFKIEDFMDLDYIGCASSMRGLGTDGNVWDKNNYYGVGGLSFRKKSFMMDAIQSNRNIDRNFPEDVFFSNHVAMSNKRPKDVQRLHNFCAQNYYVTDSWGSHKVDVMFAGTNKKDFQDYCPESIGI